MNVSEFLKIVWDLPGYYVIGVRQGESWQWFTADPGFAELILERFKETADIYYGVNPRKNDPNGGKGSDSDVEEANTFFVDLDFKERKECKPGIVKDDPETHELELCYEENGKTVYVHRPPLKDVIEKLEKVGLTPIMFVVDSGNGYQILWKNTYALKASKWKKIEEEIIEKVKQAGLPVDPQVKDLSRVLRLPGSINHRSGREAKVIYVGDKITILPEKYEKLVQNLLPCFKKADDRRFEFVGHLSGYLARHDVPLEDAELIVETLYNRAGIKPAEHVRDVKYTYKDYQEGKPVTGFKQLKELCEELGVSINPVLASVKEKKKDKKEEKKEEEGQLGEEKPIQSFDVLRVYHDFQHGKSYVATWKAVKQKRVDEDGIEYWINTVKIDKVYVNENGNIHALTDEEYEKLKEEYLSIINLSVKPEEFLELNLPTEIKPDVKISEVYKKVLAFIKERVTFRWEEDYIAVAIWTISSYFYRVFLAFPYLAPLKGGYNSGGTELLRTLKKIMPRPMLFNDPTPASIYTSAEQKDVSQLFDEFRDNISKERIEEIKNILRVGYMKNGTIPRVEMRKGGRREVVEFNAYSPRVIIDQSLITSEYDIASRCLFVWLIRDPNRKATVLAERPVDLINELYSVFLKYAPQVYSLYNNIESGLTGRYDQLFRPLLTIAQLIDSEDGSLKVKEQLLKSLKRSIEFSESIALEGDPQKKVISLVVEYIKDSIGEYIEGKISIIPKPWHVYEEGEGEVYIFVTDLRKKVTEYAVEVYQRDISYRYDQEGKSAIGEREWERLNPEIEEFLKERKFTALLKKFFPENVRTHRDRNTFFLKFDDYRDIISLKYIFNPSRVAAGGEYIPGGNLQSGGSYLSQSTEQNTNPLKTPWTLFASDSDSDSEIKIQNTSAESQNSKSLGELSFNSSLQFSNNMPKSELIRATQFRLDSDSEIKFLSRENYKEGGEKNKATQDMTAKEQKIYEILNKILGHTDAVMPLTKLTQEELRLLPDMREMGLVNFDNETVWLTTDGYLFIQEIEKRLQQKK